jgi:hypothetical protein
MSQTAARKLHTLEQEIAASIELDELINQYQKMIEI